MLDFVAETAREAGLTDYRVIANVGPSAGQTASDAWRCLAAGLVRIAVRPFAPDYWLWVMAPPNSPAAHALPEY